MFHEMPLKLYFMKCSERKLSQCILPLMPDIKLLEENDSWILRCKSCFFYLSDPLVSLDCTHKTAGNSIATGLKIIERDL